MPDLLGGDLLSGAAPASGGAGGFDNFFAAAPVSVAVPTNGNGSSITFDGFDPRGTASTTPATAPAMPSPAAGALAAGQGGRDLFGQEFAGFSAAPPAASGFLGGGGGAVSQSTVNVVEHAKTTSRLIAGSFSPPDVQ